jgi:hypothetical protein
MKQAHHQHTWVGVDTRRRGFFRRRWVLILRCTGCKAVIETDVGKKVS